LAIETIIRVFLGCYFLSVAVLYGARLSGIRLRSGRNSVRRGRRGSANYWHQAVFAAFRAAILVICIARIVQPSLDSWLGVVPVLSDLAVLNLFGAGAMLASLGWIEFCYAFMGASWASGTDAAHLSRSDLVTTGPYAVSRNPIFLGVLAGQAGFFLALPSVFTLTCLAVGIAVIYRQSRIEETALSTQFGSSYDAYRRRVPKWLGLSNNGGWWLGRKSGQSR